MANEFDGFNEMVFGGFDECEGEDNYELTDAEYRELIGEVIGDCDADYLVDDADEEENEDADDGKVRERTQAKNGLEKKRKKRRNIDSDGDSGAEEDMTDAGLGEIEGEWKHTENRQLLNNEVFLWETRGVDTKSSALENWSKRDAQRNSHKGERAEKRSYSRKFCARGDREDLKETLARGGKAAAAMSMAPEGAANSPDEEQKRDLRIGAIIATDVFDTMVDIGDKASSDLQKREAFMMLQRQNMMQIMRKARKIMKMQGMHGMRVSLIEMTINTNIVQGIRCLVQMDGKKIQFLFRMGIET